MFISSSGVFLIAFDSNILNSGKIRNHYYSSIGTYVDLIWQTTTKEKIQPKIALVATKVEVSRPLEENFTNVLDFAKFHVGSILSENGILLLDEVLKTSSAEVTEEALRGFHRKVATLCFHTSLRVKPNELRPLSWHKFLGVLQRVPAISLQNARQQWLTIKDEVGQTKNISGEDLEGLEKLKVFLEQIVQIENYTTTDDVTAVGPVVEVESMERSLEVAEVKDSLVKPNRRGSLGERSKESPLVGEEGVQRATAKGATEDKGKLNVDVETVAKVRRGIHTDEVMKEMSTILTYFVNEGEVLWYKQREDLCNILITRPMDLIKSLRTIITHKAAKRFQGVKFEQRKRDIQEIGLLSFADFQEIYSTQAFPAKETWDFIAQLSLGIPVQKSKEEMVMMIPCLINDSMEAEVNEIEREFSAHEEALCLRYLFDRNSSTIGLYHKFLEVFTQTFLWRENGGDFRVAFSQKVESKKLGCVGGVHGTIRWIATGIQHAEVFNFLILEYETAFGCEDPDDTPQPFSRDRAVRIYLKPKKGEISSAVFEIFRRIDKEFSSFLTDVQRSLSCKECEKGQFDGSFFLDKGIELTSTERPCTRNRRHDPPERIVQLLEKSGGKKPFNLDTLMAQEKSMLGLEPFGNSQIKKDMEVGVLEPGHQIWIYHDSQTDPCNLVARMNKYAHVVIYTGLQEAVNGNETTEIHEVVHVSKSSIAKGVMKATIRRQEVLRVTKSTDGEAVIRYGAIKPNQMVFLGHKIEGCQFAANVREKIVERALKCAEKPSIVFDYDYRWLL